MGPTGFNQLVGHGFQQNVFSILTVSTGPTGIGDLLVLFSWLDMGFNRVFSIPTLSTEDLQVYGTYRYMGPTGFIQLVGHWFQQGVLNPHCKYRGPTGIWDLLVLISWLDMGFNRMCSQSSL